MVKQELGKIYLRQCTPHSKSGWSTSRLGNSVFILHSSKLKRVVPFRIGNAPYTDSGWYEQTAGVVELPVERRLTEQELQDISENLLALALTPLNDNPRVAIEESPGGIFVRADQFVFRLNPNETADVSLFATRWGERYAGARIRTIAVSTNYIAAAIEISPGNLYYHFRNKEEIIKALFERLFIKWDETYQLPSNRVPELDDFEALLASNYQLIWDYRFAYREMAILLHQVRDLQRQYQALRKQGY